MTALYIISFLLLVVATIALLKLTPEQINKDINELFNKQQIGNGILYTISYKQL